MNYGTATTVDSHAIVSIHLITSQHKDHLEPWKSTHEAAMFLSKACHCLGCDKGEVHTGFQQEAITLRKLVQVETLGMADEVSDGPPVLGNHDDCWMTGETASEPWQAPSYAGTHQ